MKNKIIRIGIVIVIVIILIRGGSGGKKVGDMPEDTTVDTTDLLYSVHLAAKSKKMQMSTLLETVEDSMDVIETMLGDTAAQLRNEITGNTGWSHSGNYEYLTTSTDSVGIGTNNPTAELHVIGDAYISSELDVITKLWLNTNASIYESGEDLYFSSPAAGTYALTDLGAPSISAGSGLTLDGTNMELHGPLTEDANISTATYRFYLNNNYGGATNWLHFQNDYTSIGGNSIYNYTDSVYFHITNANGIRIWDLRNTVYGMTYYQDYSSSLQTNSLSIPDVKTSKIVAVDTVEDHTFLSIQLGGAGDSIHGDGSSLYMTLSDGSSWTYSADGSDGRFTTDIVDLTSYSGSYPGTPDGGYICFRSDLSAFMGYDGSEWDTLNAVGGAAGNPDGDDYDIQRNVSNSFYADDSLQFDAIRMMMLCKNGTGRVIIGSANTGVVTGNNCTMIGANAGASSTVGTGGTFVGYAAGYNSGLYNTLVGYAAGYTGSSSDSNTYIGYQAGYSGSGNDGCVIIGHKAGYSGGNIDGSIFIGNRAGYYENTGNKLYIDNSGTSNPLIYGDFYTDYLKFNADSVVNTGIMYYRYYDPGDTVVLGIYPNTHSHIDTISLDWSADDEFQKKQIPFREYQQYWEDNFRLKGVRKTKDLRKYNEDILRQIERNFIYDAELREKVDNLQPAKLEDRIIRLETKVKWLQIKFMFVTLVLLLLIVTLFKVKLNK